MRDCRKPFKNFIQDKIYSLVIEAAMVKRTDGQHIKHYKCNYENNHIVVYNSFIDNIKIIIQYLSN